MAGELDTFLAKFGNPGRYQIFVFILLITSIFPVSFHHFAMVIYGNTPTFRCKLPDLGSRNLSTSPRVNNSNRIDSCYVYANPLNKSLGKELCPYGWEYDYENQLKTIGSDWDLVCDREYLVSLSTTIYFLGVMICGPFVGIAADQFGRRPIILISLYGQLLISVSIAFSQSYVVFVVLRFFLGLFTQSILTSAAPPAMELFQPHQRTIAGVIMELVWPTTQIIIIVVTMHVSSWRHIQLSLSLFSLVSLTYFWLLPESLRWLITCRKLDEAQKILERCIRFNRISVEFNQELKQELQDVADSILKNSANTDQNYVHGFRDLFRTKRLALVTTVTCCWWFTVNMLYYGLSYMIPRLGGNFYQNLLIGISIEFVTIIAMYFILGRFGRRIPLTICLNASGFCCLAVFIIGNFDDSEELQMVRMFFTLTGKVMASACFTCITIYSVEVAPTVIRSLAVGVSSCFGRIATAIAPQMITLGKLVWQPLPFLIFAIVGISCGMITPFMPETLGKPMPEILEDIDKLWIDKNKIVHRTNSMSDSTLCSRSTTITEGSTVDTTDDSNWELKSTVK